MNYPISIVSFLVCLAIGFLISKSRAFHFLSDRETRFESLYGLRGFLAISVLFHHFAITYYWKNNGEWGSPAEIVYKNYGKVGVGIFFMITGFLFISKLIHANWKLDWLSFFESRVFRIFPIYLVAVLLILGIVIHNSDYQLDSPVGDFLMQMIAWILFHGDDINNFQDTRLIIAGVDWTLKYEWLFYFSLPLVAMLFRSRNKKYIAMFYLLIIVFYFKSVDVYSFNSGYAILFLLGGASAYIVASSDKLMPYAVTSKKASLLSCILIIGIMYYPRTFDVFHISLMFFYFVLIVLGNDMFGLLKLSSAKVLGEVSYSIYLLHGLVLYLLFTQYSVIDIVELDVNQYSLLMPAVAALVVLVSVITFLFVEKPSIEFGRRHVITKKWRS